nr:glycosyltransferase family 4 protein [uncultured Butyrivibrio sp.]
MATGGTGGIESLARDYANLSTNNNYFVFFWGGGVNAEKIKASGHNVIELGVGRKEFFKTYTKLKKLVDEYGIEAIVTHHAAPMFYVYMMLLKNRSKDLRTLIYAHGNLTDMLRAERKGVFFRKQIFAFAYKRCTKLIAISNSVKNSIGNYGFNTDKIQVIYNGVDCKKFYNSNDNTGDTVKIIYVGRLIKQKGVDMLLDALKQIDNKCEFECDIVGDGPERKNLEKQLNDLNMRNHISFRGTRSDVPELLKKADLFIHPARWEEGFGISIVEAMAAGVVPIAFLKGAIPEIISDGVDGFIVQGCNADELAVALEKAVVGFRQGELQRFAEAAKEKASKFQLEDYVELLDNAITA